TNHPAVQSVFAASRIVASFARAVAEKGGRLEPDCAAAAGLLAPLGWLALTATKPDAVAACLADDALRHQPDAVQQRYFGSTTAEIARRLARRWELPAWLAAVVGYLDLPANVAPTFGGDPLLTTVVHAAVGLAARAGANPLALATGSSLDESLARLGLDAAAFNGPHRPPEIEPRANPYDAPLLPQLLELAAENAGRRETHLVPRLESEVDRLHRLLLDQRAGEGERLRCQKLSALAEFAAGAGHEINNPLAVISGQAQYLLGLEADPDRQRSLRTIVQQTQRIHQILTDLMQFAKPAKPQKRAVDVRDLAHEASVSQADLAAQRQVRVELLTPDEPCVTHGDPKQLLAALGGLLRNAIEAAPVSGWARLRIEIDGEPGRLGGPWLRLVVEDSGPGPADTQTEHLFDPFFSGRPAGRGRGLGLSTAWRLVRENGGDVSYELIPSGPTRFVITLPRIVEPPIVQPLAA
ncbi:MAG TPA: HAMP domain-containing sensor histidine kinase, partial [Gemmataceae bacterium]|nr:HAMP domain-containing sensor histidine kinase [Gemmataceae bacterium]